MSVSPSGSGRRELDVGIVGGGLAGSLLARQLRRALPGARIAVFERSDSWPYKVGEATVEIAANYLVRRLGLSSYLYENHLPKNGLRYFFDDASCSLPIDEMSEIGTTNLPFHPSFQLDRSRLEADLLELNRRDGVEVRRGARVRNIALGRGGEAHRFDVREEDGETRYTARWMVDAAGRVGLFARKLGLREPERSHRIGSVWGRFEGVADIDALGPEPFRGRVRHTPRRLSTLHFWYPGYWVWFIPLRGGITSVGVTGRVAARNPEMRTPEGFRAFLERHRAIRELVAQAKNIDIGGYSQIAYGTQQFFSPDRWGLTGEAASSTDPLYSPGSDFIALENDFICDLIQRDLGGEDAQNLSERCRLYDEFAKFRHAATMGLYAGLYDCMGSFDVARLKWDFDIASYYNLWVDAYMRDLHLELDYLEEQLRLAPFVLRAIENFAGLFRHVEETLRARGEYFRNNSGLFHYGLQNIGFEQQVGRRRSSEDVLATAAETFNGVRARALELLSRADHRDAVDPLPITAFLGRRALV